MAYRTSVAARNVELNALRTEANTGYLRIYSGAQPATPESTASGVLLAELRFASTAFGAAAAGVITANAITADASANATGTAGWYRSLKSDGTTTLWDGAAGLAASTQELRLNSLAISSGANVSFSSLTYTLPM